MNITVYLGATLGNDSKYKNAVEELGYWIGNNSHTLIYGGSNVGLMGILADSVLRAGGKVVGIEVEMFVKSQVQHNEITELIIVPTFSERKVMMFNMGDVYIAVPGGVGTLDEMAEVISQSAIGLLKGPCIFYNLDGFYDYMKKQIEVMDKAGFLANKNLSNVHFADTIEDVAAICESAKKE